MTLSKTEKMIAEKDGAIGWITFNNPARHNAVSMVMWEALYDIVTDYANDDMIRVIVVKGAEIAGPLPPEMNSTSPLRRTRSIGPTTKLPLESSGEA